MFETVEYLMVVLLIVIPIDLFFIITGCRDNNKGKILLGVILMMGQVPYLYNYLHLLFN